MSIVDAKVDSGFNTRHAMLYGAAGFVALVGAVAHAQPYPNRAIRLVVPFAPGGSTDTLARIMGQRMTESMGQTVIIDNRPSGGGTTGTDLVAKAQPDGYTLTIGSIATFAMAKAMYPQLPYEPQGDFEHIGLWVTFPLALVVPAGSPITNLKDLIAQAKTRPGALRYGSQGIGTSAHIFGDLMSSMAGVKVVSVPYKGGGPALTGVLVGEVDYAMIAVSTALAQVNAGKLRALGVTSAKPTATMPNVPAIATVVPGYEGLNFHGMHAPAKTPRAIVQKLHDETTRILLTADMRERLNGLAMDIAATGPAEYRAFIQAQIEQWTPLVKSSGARAD
ncbi:MAG TPA: tripartite tricarboxylate transporter substrate binding protein [Burkholderiales bacterium]|nr:tripartite tricarboxylate transporter substrate binding protein [Burkholderiales bacterium]